MVKELIELIMKFTASLHSQRQLHLLLILILQRVCSNMFVHLLCGYVGCSSFKQPPQYSSIAVLPSSTGRPCGFWSRFLRATSLGSLRKVRRWAELFLPFHWYLLRPSAARLCQFFLCLPLGKVGYVCVLFTSLHLSLQFGSRK